MPVPCSVEYPPWCSSPARRSTFDHRPPAGTRPDDESSSVLRRPQLENDSRGNGPPELVVPLPLDREGEETEGLLGWMGVGCICLTEEGGGGQALARDLCSREERIIVSFKTSLVVEGYQ
jgi:hypothetical protein